MASSERWEPVEDGDVLPEKYGERNFQVSKNGTEITMTCEGIVIWASGLPPNLRLCRRVEGAPQPLDMPDGPGWYAFKGDHVIVGHHPTEAAINIVEWEPNDEHPFFRFSTDRYPRELKAAWFREEWDGKWYRLTMPWEQEANDER